jgi:hypothetical protein
MPSRKGLFRVLCSALVIIVFIGSSSIPVANTLSQWVRTTQILPLSNQVQSLQKKLDLYVQSASKEGMSSEDESGLVTTPGTDTTIVKNFTTYVSSGSAVPTGSSGNTLYYTSDGLQAGTTIYTDGSIIGIGTTLPKAKLHLMSNSVDRTSLLIQSLTSQTANLLDLQNVDGASLASFNSSGKLTLSNGTDDHSIELTPTGNAGYLSSNGGAIFINNTSNLGSGIGIYSNAGAEALGNMINVKVDNPLYNQAAFYMDYDGISNAVEIISNTQDSSSNALSVTNNNTQDSAVGVIGYETGKGTIKVSHNGTGTDSNASGISIDLKGTGTRAQGVYVDSTASGGTLGNLLRLRNQSIDRFVVDSLGGLKVGGNGTNTSITKYGNTVGDEFFVGTNGSFRVQRSSSDSEAFRVQINGDTQGRWLGTSDGKLKWGDGSSAQDVILRRSAAATLLLDSATFTINSGNLGIGTTSFGSNAAKVLAIGNGTAPTTSITDGVQLYAIDYVDGDGTSTSELFVRDEDGNATNLSPHNFSLVPQGRSEPLAWSYYSEKNGQAINVDMAKTIRLVEELSGTKLIYTKDLTTGMDINSDYSSLAIPTLSSLQQYIANQPQQIESIQNDVISQSQNTVKKDDLVKNMTFTDEVITILKKMVITSEAIFQSTVEFVATVIFHDSVTFDKTVTVKGALTVSKDQAGRLNIKQGETIATYTFSTPFANEPVITITPNDAIIGSYWVKKTKTDFTVFLSEIQKSDIQFDWHALTSQLENDSSKNNEKEKVIPTHEVTITPVASASAEEND